MRVDKGPVKDNVEKNEFLDLDDACDIESTFPSPNRILSSSSSSSSASEGEQTGVDDSDNDTGFVGISQGSLDRLDTVTPNVNHGIDGCCVMEPGSKGIYDREAILCQLASSEYMTQGPIIENIERMQKAFAKSATNKSTESSGNFGDEYQHVQITDEECKKSVVERLRIALEAVPDSMLYLLTGLNRPGDCGRPSDQKPDWLDMDKLRRGQKFARDHLFSIYFSDLLSLFALFSFEDGLKPMIVTGKSSTPYTAFKRYLSAGLRIRHWYTQDPWAKGTSARNDILTVRAMHAAVRRKLESSTDKEIDAAASIPEAWCPTREMLINDFSETCEAPVLGQYPYLAERNSPHRPKGINQFEMALTQWGSVGIVTSYPKLVGVHYATDEDLEAFCHLWRSIGYQLGIEDEYNFCRGSLREIRQRSRDFLETWVKPNLREITPEWEHMMRCIFTGFSVLLPGTTYETALLYLTELLDLQMPRFYASLSYRDWINHNLTKSVFYYTTKLPGTVGLINSLLNRALDRAEKFTPEEIEAIRIKLSNKPENNTKTDKNSIGTSA